MEEDLNMWLSFYMNESVNHDFAIRRFCPARMEQDQDQEALIFDEIELCNSDPTTSNNPFLASSEVDDFVDSFINMDQYYEDQDSSQEKKHQNYDHFIVNEEEEEDNDDDVDVYSMLMNDDVIGYVPTIMDDEEIEICENSTITILDEEVEMSNSFDNAIITCEKEANLDINQGLDLVHMLLACAEAVSCKDTNQAKLLLSRIWCLANPLGDSLQRVSYCFAKGLKCRLSLLPHNVFTNSTSMDNVHLELITRETKLEAFQLLYQTTPYISFGFMVANEAIIQASKEKSSIHIIDLGMEHTFQWSSLIRALSSRSKGSQKLKITGFTINDEDIPQLQTSMNLLVDEARNFGIHFEFNIISKPLTPSLLTKENLKLKEGEALFFNSILQLHKYVRESRSYLKEILISIKKLSPIALTMVEQDTNHNGPFFLGRFLESLHYYSAIFDSLEASMSRSSNQRMKIERVHFGEEICNIVGYEGKDRMERHERVNQWRRQLGRAGFQVMPLKCTSQVRMMLSVYDCDGYTLSCEKGILLLGWKGRPIMMASTCQVASVSCIDRPS